MSIRLPKGNMSIIEFQKRYDTEDKCRDFFIRLRYPHGFVCPHYGCSAVQLQRALKVNYDTAYYTLQRLRKAMRIRDDRYMLKGVIELDDTYVGTTTHGKKRGRGTEKSKVIVAVAKTANNATTYIKMQVVPNLKAITYGKFAKKRIAEGSKIESDNSASLKKGLAEKYFVKYETFSPEKGMLRHLHTAISNMKSFINGTYHGVTKEHLQEYLDEFDFRYNRRKFGECLFERLANAVFV